MLWERFLLILFFLRFVLFGWDILWMLMLITVQNSSKGNILVFAFFIAAKHLRSLYGGQTHTAKSHDTAKNPTDNCANIRFACGCRDGCPDGHRDGHCDTHRDGRRDGRRREGGTMRGAGVVSSRKNVVPS